LVERPKYLFNFEYKESEQDFLYLVSKNNNRQSALIIFLFALTNKALIIV